jgi:hypothetical protein
MRPAPGHAQNARLSLWRRALAQIKPFLSDTQAPMPEGPNHPPKWWGNSQFVTILPLAPRAGYVTIWSLKT